MQITKSVNLRIGGWTRIWLVLSVLFFFLSYQSASSDYSRAASKADSDYSKIASNAEWAKQHPEEAEKEAADCVTNLKKWPDDALLKTMCDARINIVSGMQETAAERERIKDDALSKAWHGGLSYGAVPSAIVGLLFLAIGWIRKGFAVKRVPASQ